jgi:hypothetical protein
MLGLSPEGQIAAFHWGGTVAFLAGMGAAWRATGWHPAFAVAFMLAVPAFGCGQAELEMLVREGQQVRTGARLP